jgi:predicted ester cyclase
MASVEHGAVRQDERQAQVNEAAERLRVLLGVSTPTDDMISAIQEVDRVAENKKVLLRFQHEVFNQGDWSTETLTRNLADGFIDHAAMPGDPPGLEGVQMRFSAWAAAFEDAEEENMAMVGEGDLLAVMYNLHARHSGDFMGIPPTNREVVIPGMEVVRIEGGKIAEHWGIYDFLRTAEEINTNLAFLPRDGSGAPMRPEVPWAVKLTESDADTVGAEAEEYLRPGENPKT